MYIVKNIYGGTRYQGYNWKKAKEASMEWGSKNIVIEKIGNITGRYRISYAENSAELISEQIEEKQI